MLFARLFVSLHLIMNKEIKESARVRVISVAFAVVALAVFKPFELGAWQWEAYVHLLAIFVLGLGICMLTEAIIRYIVKMPRSLELGVDYIIRRNLRFQLINIPLISLMICLYRHFVLSDRVPANRLSWGNFFETLLIMTFISFAIGLYWRFKFRSRYLAIELEETRQLNKRLKAMQEESRGFIHDSDEKADNSAIHPQERSLITLTGTTNETVTLHIADLLYIEAVGNYVKVCHLHNCKVHTDMLRSTSKQMEEQLQAYPSIIRSHRAFLINLQQVEQIVSKSGTMQLIIRHSHDTLPVSRSNMAQIKEAITKSRCR